MRGQVVFVVLFLRSRPVSTLLLLLSEQARLAFDDLGDVTCLLCSWWSPSWWCTAAAAASS